MAFNAREQLATVPVVGRETTRLVHVLRSWPQSYWSRPAYCPGWTAADAVAHLTMGGDFYAQVITAGRSGEPIFPWGVKTPEEFREVRQAASKKLIDGGPTALVEGFEQKGAQLQVVLESLQESDLAKVARHPRGLIPIGLWIGMRLVELSAHDWDMRQPHETPAHLSPSALPALLSVIPEMQCQFLQQRVSEGLDGVYVLRAGDVAWGFRVHGQTVTYQPAAPTACDTVFSTDAESMCLLTLGRADVDAKLQSAALTITGNAAKGQQFCATLFRAF
jgi:uncharacterized protein (TIGR03083 family)